MVLTEYEIIGRLIVSLLLATIIGIEREHVRRPAGLRTHILVSVGATLITLIAIDGLSSDTPSRLIVGVVTGIGFLGAGTIFRAKDHVVGLTTAASIWSVAAVGIAVGAGYYLAAIVTALIMYLTLKINRLEKGRTKFFKF